MSLAMVRGWLSGPIMWPSQKTTQYGVPSYLQPQRHELESRVAAYGGVTPFKRDQWCEGLYHIPISLRRLSYGFQEQCAMSQGLQ